MRYAATLISPRHIITAAHTMLNVGNVFRFITQDNVVVERTMTAKLLHPGYVAPTWYPDLAVGVLDSDVPGTISFAKILPSDWTDYLSRYGCGVPVMVLDQEEKALVADLRYISDPDQAEAKAVLWTSPQDATRLSFYETVVSGDCGNPGLMVIDDELVILTVTTGNGGDDISYYQDDINTMMTTLGGGYQLTPIDLSKYAST